MANINVNVTVFLFVTINCVHVRASVHIKVY
jgi:hypothetical protein